MRRVLSVEGLKAARNLSHADEGVNREFCIPATGCAKRAYVTVWSWSTRWHSLADRLAVEAKGNPYGAVSDLPTGPPGQSGPRLAHAREVAFFNLGILKVRK